MTITLTLFKKHNNFIPVSKWSIQTYHSDESANELKVFEVVGVDGGGGVYLKAVVVFAGVFKQTVHGVQDLMREQEKPFPVIHKTLKIKKNSA